MGRQLAEIAHADEVLLRQTGGINDLWNVGHTGLIKNRNIKVGVLNGFIYSSFGYSWQQTQRLKCMAFLLLTRHH